MSTFEIKQYEYSYEFETQEELEYFASMSTQKMALHFAEQMQKYCRSILSKRDHLFYVYNQRSKLWNLLSEIEFKGIVIGEYYDKTADNIMRDHQLYALQNKGLEDRIRNTPNPKFYTAVIAYLNDPSFISKLDNSKHLKPIENGYVYDNKTKTMRKRQLEDYFTYEKHLLEVLDENDEDEKYFLDVLMPEQNDEDEVEDAYEIDCDSEGVIVYNWIEKAQTNFKQFKKEMNKLKSQMEDALEEFESTQQPKKPEKLSLAKQSCFDKILQLADEIENGQKDEDEDIDWIDN